MKTLFAVLLISAVSVSAETKTYSTGRAEAIRYTTTTTTVGCSGSGYSVDCQSVDRDHGHAMYSFTFPEGYTRLLMHASGRPDPLKNLVEPTDVQFRTERHMGITYVLVLDSRGKDGWYFFATRDDDPTRKAKAEYGPAPAPPPAPAN
jgi:hypothetical protein